MQAALATSPARLGGANEDFAAVSPSAAVLLDGAGNPPGLESGCSHGVAWFARTLGSVLLAEVTASDDPLAECLAQSIRTARAMHEDTCDLSHPGSPSATVVAVRARGSELEYLVLADSVLVIQDGASAPLVITDVREQDAGRAHRAAMDTAPLSSDAHTAALRDYVEALRAHRNQPGGFWVAAADPAAAREALTGQVLLTGTQTVILASDGATRMAGRFRLISWPELAKIVASDGPSELIRRTRAAEASDPHGQRWPRGKASDDATAIRLHDLG